MIYTEQVIEQKIGAAARVVGVMKNEVATGEKRTTEYGVHG